MTSSSFCKSVKFFFLFTLVSALSVYWITNKKTISYRFIFTFRIIWFFWFHNTAVFYLRTAELLIWTCALVMIDIKLPVYECIHELTWDCMLISPITICISYLIFFCCSLSSSSSSIFMCFVANSFIFSVIKLIYFK